jgi:hypothetical protein
MPLRPRGLGPKDVTKTSGTIRTRTYGRSPSSGSITGRVNRPVGPIAHPAMSGLSGQSSCPFMPQVLSKSSSEVLPTRTTILISVELPEYRPVTGAPVFKGGAQISS